MMQIALSVWFGVLTLQTAEVKGTTLLLRKVMQVLFLFYMHALFYDVINTFIYFAVARWTRSDALHALWHLTVLFAVPAASAQAFVNPSLEEFRVVTSVVLFVIGISGVVFVLALIAVVMLWYRCPFLVRTWWSAYLTYEWVHFGAVLFGAVLFWYLVKHGSTSVPGAYYRHALRTAFFHPTQLNMRFGDIPIDAPYFICNTAMSGSTLQPQPPDTTTPQSQSQSQSPSVLEQTYIHRISGSFVLTPLHYGHHETRYHRPEPAQSPRLKDGMGSSGAAIGINMG
jgi:hypothetical protein